MMTEHHQSILCNLMLTIYMVGSWVSTPTGGFKWFSEKAFNAVNLAEYTEVGGKKDWFLKLIWSIHVNDMIVIMTTNLPLKNMCFWRYAFKLLWKDKIETMKASGRLKN